MRRVWFGAASLESEDAPDGLVLAADAQVTPADTLVLVHTSGSTSAPKGVIHTHGQVIRNMRRQNAARRYTADEVLFANAPWFWVGGLAYSFLATLIAGARLLCSSARPAQMLDLIERERPSMTNGVASTMLALEQDPSFAGRDLSFMRRGNLYPIMPPEVRPKDPELRHNLLGMTEAGSVCIVGDSEDDLPEAMRGSYGKPVAGVDMRVVDPETGLDGPEGELWLRGPNVMQGYYGRERHEAFDEEGWYHSGDMFGVDRTGLLLLQGPQRRHHPHLGRAGFAARGRRRAQRRDRWAHRYRHWRARSGARTGGDGDSCRHRTGRRGGADRCARESASRPTRCRAAS